MKSIQTQYNQILEGKGDKYIFLKHIKAMFPQYIPNPMGFDDAITILKQRSILNEGFKEPVIKKSESFEDAFKEFLNEAKKKEKEVKADLKKTDKSVEKVLDSAYDNEEIKNADNVIFDQYMRGMYVELSNDINQDLETVKKKVLKNLTKDPIYYVKNGQFGLKDVGYTDEAPTLKPSKSDEVEILDKSKPKSNVKDTLSKKESAKGNPKKVKEMPTKAKKASGVKKMADPGKEKIIKLKEGMGLNDLLDNNNASEIEESYSSKSEESRDYWESVAGSLKDDGMDETDIAAWLEDQGLSTKEATIIASNVCKNKLDENEDIDLNSPEFKAAMEEAERISKEEGVVQHVETAGNGKYKVSDWFDADKTIASFENGSRIFENVDEAKGSKIPKGWTEEKDLSNYNSEGDKSLYGGEVVKSYYAPMDGWDDEHLDDIKIIKKDDGTFMIEIYYAFGGENEEASKAEFNSLEEALSEAIDIMKEIKDSWDEERVNEGTLEDADAQLAKQEADAEAKAAQLAKQRADNKAKIAISKKNI